MRSAPATVSRLRLSSTASTAGSAKSCVPTMPTPTFRALHGWRRYGKRSSAPRAIPNLTIWSENRWFSRYSGCSRKRRGNAPHSINPNYPVLSDKGIRGGLQEESFEEEKDEGRGRQGGNAEEARQEGCRKEDAESARQEGEEGCEEADREEVRQESSQEDGQENGQEI